MSINENDVFAPLGNEKIELTPEMLDQVTGGKLNVRVFQVHGNHVNIRSKPTTDSKSLIKMNDGDDLFFLDETIFDADGYLWGKVLAGDQVGWIRKDLVRSKKKK